MPDDGADFVPISALQHWCYCQRQCALIHVEGSFVDNVHTLRGQAVHASVDTPGLESRAGVRVERALPIWSDSLGLIGKADVVEFLSDGTPFPIEYKHGSRNKAARIAACDDIQLAAQAICLEEVSGKPVPEGALFYSRSKRRRLVVISPALRADVSAAVSGVRALLGERVLPPPVDDARCKECSLNEICQPHVLTRLERGRALREALFDPDS